MADIFSSGRQPVLVEARGIVVWLTRKLTGLSYPAIGKLMLRDHATVIHALRQTEKRLRCPGAIELRARVQVVCRRLGVNVPAMEAA